MKYISCIFLKEGITEKELSPMDGVDYHTLSSGLVFIEKYLQQGITDFLVFGSTDNKSIDFACESGLIKNFIQAAKEKFKDTITLYADAGLSPYLEDGHSLIVGSEGVDLVKSYELASKLAVAFARAGADYICPCLPLENQVYEIRQSLNKAGFENKKIMGYSAKFASSLYGPYFKTVQSGRDGKTPYEYHISPKNDVEALEHIRGDEKQGADIVMVKPAIMYLDIIHRVRQITKLPLAVYNVSGEYTMIKAGAKTDMLDESEVFDELHTAFARCGVDYVIGYAPDHFIRWNKKNF